MSGEAGNPYREAIAGMADLANALLEKSTVYDEKWRRVVYDAPEERTAAFYEALLSSPVGSLLFRPGETVPQHEVEAGLTAEEYARYGLDENGLIPGTEAVVADVPKKIQLIVDEDKKTANDPEPRLSFRLSLIHHEVRDGEGYIADMCSVNLSHTVGKMAVTRSVIVLAMAESGYTGHCIVTEPVEPEALQELTGLIKQNCVQFVPHLSFEEEEKIAEYRCGDTGRVFRYDPEAGTHVSDDGIKLGEYVSPLHDLEEQFIDPENPPALREIRSVIRYVPKDKQ